MSGSEAIAAAAVAVVLALVGGGAWFVLRRRVRSRLTVIRQIHADPEIAEWVVVFDWTNKILYLPTIAASVLAAAAAIAADNVEGLRPITPALIGGIWFAAVALNFIIEEWRFGLRGVLIAAGTVLLVLVVLQVAGLVNPLIALVSRLGVRLNAAAYLVIAALGSLAIAASWARGLLHFVAITPSYVLVQRGLSKAAQRVAFDECTIELDKRDVLKRLLGFGRIVVTFKDPARPPVVMLVGRIGTRAAMLKAVRRQVERNAAIVTAEADGPEAPKTPKP